MWIWDNHNLTSLSGIDNIEASTIHVLYIYQNYSLSYCEIQSLCDYLSPPFGETQIHDNAPGCNSPEEVLDSCEAHAGYIDIKISEDNLIIYPNPAYQELNISAEGFTIDEVAIFSPTGQQVYTIRPKNTTIDISSLSPGIYIVEVMVEARQVRQKLVVKWLVDSRQ